MKTKPMTDHPVLPDTRGLSLEETISRQAYQLWTHYGQPEGRDVAIWLEAERQVLGVDPAVNKQPGGAVPAAPLGDILYPPVKPDLGAEPAMPQPSATPRVVV